MVCCSLPSSRFDPAKNAIAKARQREKDNSNRVTPMLRFLFRVFACSAFAIRIFVHRADLSLTAESSLSSAMVDMAYLVGARYSGVIGRLIPTQRCDPSMKVTSGDTTSAARLRDVDEHWQRACEQYAIHVGFGFKLVPSSTLSGALSVFGLVSLGFMVEMVLWKGNSVEAWCCAIFAICVFALSAFVTRKAKLFANAQMGWRGQRARVCEVSGMAHAHGDSPIQEPPTWHSVLLKLAIVAGMVFVYDFFSFALGTYWVGFKDLEITFLVTNAETNLPIARAIIDVPESKRAFCDECNDAFKLVTDVRGTAKRMCKNCMCFGSSGLPGRWNSFGTHVPSWVYHASAPGFHQSASLHLEQSEFRQTVVRGDRLTTMQVAIKLQPVRNLR